MADAMLSVAAERLIALIAEEARYHVNLVRGAEKEVRSLVEKLNSIRIALDDAENRRFKDKKINYWMSRLEATSYEMEDILDEWDYAILKLHMDEHDSDDDVAAPAPKQMVCSFIPSSLCFKKTVVRHRIAKKILNVKDQYDVILKDKEQFNFVSSHPTPDPAPESWRIQSTSLIDVAKVHGRERDTDILVGKLMDNGGSQEELGIQVVSIVGVGGLGKTTLAQLVYNHSQVEESFKLRVWICVSDPFDMTAIAKGILESIEGSSPNTNQLDVLLKRVKESVLGKKFLLVLDDVWTEDYNKWEPLESALSCGGVGSKILVTTRSKRVAKKMGTRESEIFSPGLLSDEDCWLFMCRMALPERNKVGFEDIGKKIAKKCKGLPLAAKTLGSLLRFKSTLEEWTNVLNSEIWKMEEVEVDIFPHLLLSYNELSSNLKRCFSYCAVFPKDSKIVVDTLIEKWMSLGYLGSNTDDIEVKGRGYFNILSMRSLFQEFKKDDLDEITSCKMHDIVHDFAQFLRKSGGLEGARMNKTSCQACDPLLVSSVNEFCTLSYVEESPPNHCDCILRLRVLSFTRCGLQSIPQGMENLIHLRWLELDGINKLSPQDLKIIFQLYYLQTLSLTDCNINEIPGEIGKLVHLRSLRLIGNESLEELPREIKNLIHLRLLELTLNKSLKELPKEIGNLIQLRHLIIIKNDSLKELPSEIGNLIHLRCLDVSENDLLQQLPDSICRLHELQTLNADNCVCLLRLPKGVAQLTGLRFVSAYAWGGSCSKLGLLKNLIHLAGVLSLELNLNTDEDFEEVVEDARDAELRNKIHIQKLMISFQLGMISEMEEEEEIRLRMDVLDALEPHPNLQKLIIQGYEGSKLPLGWIVSPLNQLRKVKLSWCNNLISLLPFGKLPCLEKIHLYRMEVLQFVGREFLGITATTIGGGDTLNDQSSSNTNVIAFPKLKKLKVEYCFEWTEWEDITEEEEECAGFQVMPCLTELEITWCYKLTALPHRLLRKASLKRIDISRSTELLKRYANGNSE
ncbi:hypothetical protein ACS0TY_004948 [Phlomoides rotata]